MQDELIRAGLYPAQITRLVAFRRDYNARLLITRGGRASLDDSLSTTTLTSDVGFSTEPPVVLSSDELARLSFIRWLVSSGKLSS